MLTQTSSAPSLAHLLESMRSTESGRRLLIERPSVNSETVDVDYLASLERGKFGREWIEWLKENGVVLMEGRSGLHANIRAKVPDPTYASRTTFTTCCCGCP